MAIAAAPEPGVSTAEAGERLTALFDAHGRMVYGLCRVLLRDPIEAEDAAQEAFLSAHRSLLGGQDPREPAAWLAAIARNECRDRIRERMRAPLTLVDEDGAEQAGLDLAADQRAELTALCDAVSELPAQQRQAVVLREFYGLSYQEAATALGLSHSAIQSLLFRARQSLQDRLRPARESLGAVGIPPSLREAIAELTASPAVPSAGATVSGGGGALVAVLSKIAVAPLASKVAVVTAAATLSGGAAVAVDGKGALFAPLQEIAHAAAPAVDALPGSGPRGTDGEAATPSVPAAPSPDASAPVPPAVEEPAPEPVPEPVSDEPLEEPPARPDEPVREEPKEAPAPPVDEVARPEEKPTVNDPGPDPAPEESTPVENAPADEEPAPADQPPPANEPSVNPDKLENSATPEHGEAPGGEGSNLTPP